jgi:hypothetical protein
MNRDRHGRRIDDDSRGATIDERRIKNDRSTEGHATENRGDVAEIAMLYRV